MEIKDFIAGYTNHPVLFIGSGFSFRYLNNTYTWDALLSKVSCDLYDSDEKYYDIKSRNTNTNGFCDYPQIATELEKDFNQKLEKDRNGKFKHINDTFYDSMRKGVNLSRFKLYIAEQVKELNLNSEKNTEISELKKARKNIGSIITTNYDSLIEKLFEFTPLVGNDILLSNPYGSVYKIHGCVSDVSKIIITKEDYEKFDKQYELIRAQMLSLFIHNPIIFLGYNVGDENIKKVLKTIFSYVQPNTEMAERIRKNFLLVEYEKGSDNLIISEHDIVVDGSNIRINKIKTDDFLSIYTALSELVLPISAMDVRKVQSIVKEIYSGGNIKVKITEDIDDVKNGDRIIAIGSPKSIKYNYMNTAEMIQNYFTIIEESNSALIELLNKQKIAESQYFPIFAFSKICSNIKNVDSLKKQQKKNIKKCVDSCYANSHTSVENIMKDDDIANSYKIPSIIYSYWNNHISSEDIKTYLISNNSHVDTNYRKILCIYDMKEFEKD